MLQLLLERGQSYDDIASLLGGSRDDMRRRARAALEELAGEDPDSEVGLTDYLLGQADPIGRADAVRHLQSDPAALSVAEELTAKLRLLAPDAELPDLPQPKKRRRASAIGASAPATTERVEEDEEAPARLGPLSGLSPRQSRLFAGIAGVAVIVLFAILAIAGVFSGDDEDAATTTAEQTADGTISEDITSVNLRPTNGGDAGGEALFGIANETQPFLDLRLAGLEAPPRDQTYVLWFLLSEDEGYPLAPIPLNDNGGFDDRFPIPQTALPVVVRTQFVDISLIDNRQLAGDIQKALQGQEVLLPYSGESVLRGRIPRLEEPPGDASDLAPPGDEGALPEDAGALPEDGSPP